MSGATSPTDPPFRPVGEEQVYQGRVITVYKGRFEGADGVRFERDIVRHPGAVAAVAVDDDDHVFLVRQYRASIDAEMWEIPAGKRDVAGEPPDVTAARELEEEVGRRPAVLEPLLELHHSPGFCDEYGYIFLARDLSPVEQRLDGPEESAMTVARVPATEAVAMALDGRITDAKSIAGILAAARRLGW
ncbi:MAG: NUDIX domain-containing protein [Acidimicrobiales bacterium]